MQDFTQLTKYFENVLGVKNVLRSDIVSTNFSKPFIFIEHFKNYSAAEKELTSKILAAVGLTFDGVEVIESNASASLIVFKDQPVSDSEIYSPRTLLLKPELKKTAWEKLKSLMSN